MIDEAHFDAMTGGDRALQDEVLTLFAEQCAVWRRLLIADAPAQTRSDAAHGLKGSARGLGLWALADRCELIEHVSRCEHVDRSALRRELAGLHELLDQALLAIAAIRASRRAAA